MVYMFLELLDEQANMISVTDGVMYLYCKWKHAFTFPLKVFSHCENRQQEMSVIKNVYVESGKFQPRNHRNDRIFPDKPVTKKPADVRMGKGKGDPVGYVFPITPGRIIFEIEGVPFEVAKEALRLAAQKLPVTTKCIVRHDYDKNA